VFFFFWYSDQIIVKFDVKVKKDEELTNLLIFKLWRQVWLRSDQNMKKRTLYYYTFLQAIQIWNQSWKILIFKIWLFYEKWATLGLFSDRIFFSNLIFNTYFQLKMKLFGGGPSLANEFHARWPSLTTALYFYRQARGQWPSSPPGFWYSK